MIFINEQWSQTDQGMERDQLEQNIYNTSRIEYPKISYIAFESTSLGFGNTHKKVILKLSFNIKSTASVKSNLNIGRHRRVAEKACAPSNSPGKRGPGIALMRSVFTVWLQVNVEHD